MIKKSWWDLHPAFLRKDYIMAKFDEVKALLRLQGSEIVSLKDRVAALVTRLDSMKADFDAQVAALNAQHEVEFDDLADDVSENTEEVVEILAPTGGVSTGGVTD